MPTPSFNPDKIKQLNALELQLFDALLRDATTAATSTVRSFAKAHHVSPSAVMRLAQKLGYTGWAELKYHLKQETQPPAAIPSSYENLLSLDFFWDKVSSSAFQSGLTTAADTINAAHYLIFLGLGTSDALAQYGARYFNNLGINAFTISDVFRPITAQAFTDTTAILLSVSGETQQVVDKALLIKRAGAKLIAITNKPHSTLAKLADINFSYEMIGIRSGQHRELSLTTQLPVVAILELLAQRASKAQPRQLL